MKSIRNFIFLYLKLPCLSRVCKATDLCCFLCNLSGRRGECWEDRPHHSHRGDGRLPDLWHLVGQNQNLQVRANIESLWLHFFQLYLFVIKQLHKLCSCLFIVIPLLISLHIFFSVYMLAVGALRLLIQVQQAALTVTSQTLGSCLMGPLWLCSDSTVHPMVVVVVVVRVLSPPCLSYLQKFCPADGRVWPCLQQTCRDTFSPTHYSPLTIWQTLHFLCLFPFYHQFCRTYGLWSLWTDFRNLAYFPCKYVSYKIIYQLQVTM